MYHYYRVEENYPKEIKFFFWGFPEKSINTKLILNQAKGQQCSTRDNITGAKGGQ